MFLNLILRETQKLDWLLKKIINPYNDYDDLINTVVFLCGRCFLLRGRKKISKLLWENYTHGIYEDGPDKRKFYIQISIFEDKVNKRLRLGQKVFTVEDRSYRVRDNPNDPINPYEIFQYFRLICPPDQKGMLAGSKIKHFSTNVESIKIYMEIMILFRISLILSYQ